MRALFGKEYEMTIEEAVCYLKKQDLAALEVGTYQVNDDFYFMIQEYETKPAENCRLETHNCYADIQWIISGEEEIDTVSRTGLEADEEYDEKRDVAFWKERCLTGQLLLSLEGIPNPRTGSPCGTPRSFHQSISTNHCLQGEDVNACSTCVYKYGDY